MSVLSRLLGLDKSEEDKEVSPELSGLLPPEITPEDLEASPQPPVVAPAALSEEEEALQLDALPTPIEAPVAAPAAPISSPEAPAPIPTETVEPPQAPTSEVRDILARLKEAQANRSQSYNAANLVGGADQALAATIKSYGGQYSPTDFSKNLIKQAELGPESITEELTTMSKAPDAVTEVELGDPDSEISKVYRIRAAKILGRPELENSRLSAKQLENILPNNTASSRAPVRTETRNIVNPKTGVTEVVTFTIDNNTGETLSRTTQGETGYAPAVYTDPTSGERVVEARRVGTSTGDGRNAAIQEAEGDNEVVDLRVKLQPTQMKALSGFQKAFNTSNKDALGAKDKLDSIQNLIEQASDNTAASGALKASIARIFEKGIMTDADVERYAKNAGILPNLRDKIHLATTGTISPQLRTELSKLMGILKTQQNAELNGKALRDAKALVNTDAGSFKKSKTSVDELAKAIYGDYEAQAERAPQSEDKSVEVEFVKDIRNIKAGARAKVTKRKALELFKSGLIADPGK